MLAHPESRGVRLEVRCLPLCPLVEEGGEPLGRVPRQLTDWEMLYDGRGSLACVGGARGSGQQPIDEAYENKWVLMDRVSHI